MKKGNGETGGQPNLDEAKYALEEWKAREDAKLRWAELEIKTNESSKQVWSSPLIIAITGVFTIKVERRAVIGTETRFEERLQQSEDSSTLNTSFIERLNLTIRQGSAYLCCSPICQGTLAGTP